MWIPFTPSQTCVQVFKASFERVGDWSSVSLTTQDLLEQIAKYLHSTTRDKETARQLAETLPRLIRVPVSPRYRNLLKLAPTIAERELPMGLNLGSFESSDNLAHLTEQARIRWTSSTGVLSSVSWGKFSGWIDTPELALLSTALMYLSPSARTAFSTWVGEQPNLPARAIGPCYAFMDCQAAFVRDSSGQISPPRVVVDKIIDCAARILFKLGERAEYQRWAAQTLVNAAHVLPEETDRLVRAVMKRYPSNPRDAVQRHIFSFAVWAATKSSHWEELVDSVVDSSLLWLVRRFAEDESDSSELLATFPGLSKLLVLEGQRSSLTVHNRIAIVVCIKREAPPR
jgi:hypothetical protein